MTDIDVERLDCGCTGPGVDVLIETGSDILFDIH